MTKLTTTILFNYISSGSQGNQTPTSCVTVVSAMCMSLRNNYAQYAMRNCQYVIYINVPHHIRSYFRYNTIHHFIRPPFWQTFYIHILCPKHSQVINIFGCFVYVSIKVFVVSYLKHVVAGWWLVSYWEWPWSVYGAHKRIWLVKVNFSAQLSGHACIVSRSWMATGKLRILSVDVICSCNRKSADVMIVSVSKVRAYG